MNQLKWKLLHPSMTMAHLGFLPAWLNENDPRPAREQLDTSYPFGGFQPFDGFTLGKKNELRYPGDPPQRPLAEARLRDELVVFYASSWVAIIQPDHSFVVARLD